MRYKRFTRRDIDESAPGYDSFLDVVTNIVGIMIILIMVFGMRVKNHSAETSAERVASPESIAELAQAESRSLAAEGEVRKLINQRQSVQRELARRRVEREKLATLTLLASQELEGRKSSLSQQRQEELAQLSQIDLAQQEIQKKERERLALVHRSKEDEIVIDNIPTPISRTVTEHEIHFRLSLGQVAYLPVNELLQELKRIAPTHFSKLKNRSRITDEIGPVGDFRLRFTLAKPPGQFNNYVQLSKWSLVPTSKSIGETVQEALSGGSLFRRNLGQYSRSKKPNVTIWVYPDSFKDFRILKKQLYEEGFLVAARPLPEGVLVSGSPDGTRSSAQ